MGDISKVQDDQVGDGTTSVVVLAGELLREAEKLVNMRLHPQTIIQGYREALNCALKTLEALSVNNVNDPEKYKEDMLKIARTTLSSKILTNDKEHFSQLAVDAVLRLKGSTNLDSIQMIKKTGGTLHESYLDEGFILDKKIGGAAQEDRERQDSRREHPDGHGQDQDLRSARENRGHGAGRGHREGGEGQDEEEGPEDHRPRHQLLHQQAADLQLPRAALHRRGRHGDRARRL